MLHLTLYFNKRKIEWNVESKALFTFMHLIIALSYARTVKKILFLLHCISKKVLFWYQAFNFSYRCKIRVPLLFISKTQKKNILTIFSYVIYTWCITCAFKFLSYFGRKIWLFFIGKERSPDYRTLLRFNIK